MMKKLIAMLLAMLMLLSLGACAQDPKTETTEGADQTTANADTTLAEENTTKAEENTTAPEDTTDSAAIAEGFSFALAGVTLVPGMPFDAAALPEAQSVFQVPSCAIEGTDNVYNYGTVEVTAFNDGKGEVIYSVYIVDANTPTDEGLYIGDTMDYVTSIYGEDYTQESGQITYQKGDTLLIIILDGDYVAGIDFRWAN